MPQFLKKSVSILLTLALVGALAIPAGEAQAAVAFGAIGSAATGTTSLSVAYPADIPRGSLIVLSVANKHPSNGPSTPTGWQLLNNSQREGGIGSNAADSGSVFSTVFVRVADGSESGNVSVSIPSGDCAVGVISYYTKASTAVWDVAATYGTDNTAGVSHTAWSVTAAANPGLRAGDMVITTSGVNTDDYSYSAQSLSASGATIDSHTERGEFSTANGNDCEVVVATHAVSNNAAVAAPVFTMTSSGGSTVAPTGATVFLRIREVAPVSSITATGGTITEANGYRIHTFTSSGTFEVTSGSGNIDYLVVAGGGGGGRGETSATGGGGAGGVAVGSAFIAGAGTFGVTVGAGGAGGSGSSMSGQQGFNSVFGSLVTAIGGGGGRTQNLAYGGGSDPGGIGYSGGSGSGGAAAGGGGSPNAGGAGTPGQGNNGGTSFASATASERGGGGGGGAGAVGGDATSSVGGAGGDGVANSYSGSSVFYGGGGGGSHKGNGSGVAGGSGGGGAGGRDDLDPTAGTANTGGGGGGATNARNGAAGGSGIVIIRYALDSQTRTTTLTSPVSVTGGISVFGALAKGAGTFVIDHPLDPKNKLLYHSFVESPEVKNLYDGIALLNAKGEATITLPAYFLALGRDYRHLATPLGEPMPNLYLKREVRKRFFGLLGQPVFTLAGGEPHGRVSWQVSAVRKDPFILANPIIPEVPKGPEEIVDVGEYICVECYE